MKQSSKRWKVLVGNYKGEKNITASPTQILTSLELVHEYMNETNNPADISDHMKDWVVKRTGCSPTLAYDTVIHGVKFNNWMNQKS